LAAQLSIDDPRITHEAAQCCKNWGSAEEHCGRLDDARKLFERALALDPELSEAHFALGLWHLRAGDNDALALKHLDQVTPRGDIPHSTAALQARRAELLFKTGDCKAAFREIQSLRSVAKHFDWVWPCCARHVAAFGKQSLESARTAVVFWRAFLREFPTSLVAESERLLCLLAIRSESSAVDISFDQFRSDMLALIDRGAQDPAYLRDRIGHWAQYEGNWVEAEKAYREAFTMEPARYGYCLGTALNFLDRHAEALPILLEQAEKHIPDAKSWFQVAVARAGTGDIDGCIAAYQRAIELDEDYDLAWFNLGGIFWNARRVAQARAIWNEAFRRFPDHDQVKKLRKELPILFEAEDL
jgi:tetratricopeptide (TPR) repeat protein